METSTEYDGYRFSLTKAGYYRKTTKPRIFLHVYIWEKYNGPKPRGYDIHHINGRKTDNRIENFELIKHGLHSKDIKYAIDVVENYHSQMNIGIKVEDTIKDHVKSVYCKPVKILHIKKKETQEDENLDVYNLAVQNNNFYDVKNIGIVHNCQKPQGLLEHLVWLSGADKEGNTIGDFFAGSGSLLRAVNKADVILCDQNDEYYDKFFDVYVKDERVYKCKKEKLAGDKNESI